MQWHVSAHFESMGGQWTLIFFGVHFGNRVLGITIFNIVIELEY